MNTPSDDHPAKRMGDIINRAHDDKRVIKFPNRAEAHVRKQMRESTDPIDVASHFDPEYRKKEVGRRTQALEAKVENHPLQRGLQWLGLVE
jgi:hypothetical protein